MKIIKSFFKNEVIVFKNEIFKDVRGEFSETYNKKKLLKIGIKKNFVQDNYSFSKNKYTFRGVHLQLKPFSQAKLLRVVKGAIIDYVIDLRPKSNLFGKKISIKLSENSNKNIYIPEGFGHAFLTLDKDTIINYKVSKYYSSKHSKTVMYNDKNIKINLNKIILKKLTLSKQDKNGLSLIELKNNFKNKI